MVASSVNASRPVPPGARPIRRHQAGPREPSSRWEKLSTEDNLEKPREDDVQPTPEWHRARTSFLRKRGFTKMAQEPKQTAAVIESRRRERTNSAWLAPRCFRGLKRDNFMASTVVTVEPGNAA